MFALQKTGRRLSMKTLTQDKEIPDTIQKELEKRRIGNG